MPIGWRASQPFSVAQVFTGREGKQVPVTETVRGLKEILEGKHDAVAEGDFYMKGGIDEVKPPGVGGQMGIYPQHVPLISRMVPGEMIVRKDGRDLFIAAGEARLREKLSSEELASVNASLARSLAQLRVKRRRRV